MNSEPLAEGRQPVDRLPKFLRILKAAPGAKERWSNGDEESKMRFVEEAISLVLWFTDEVAIQRVRQGTEDIADELVGSQAHDDKIDYCVQLERCASLIAERFDYLHQLAPAQTWLYAAYRSELQSQSASPPLSERAMWQRWNAFRNRVRTEAILLAKIATTARVNLKERGGRRGRPALNWRNNLFAKLFRRLSELLPTTQEQRVEVAIKVWNLYFPNNQIIETDAAKKILRRARLAKA